jgi:hypothetical protein
VLPLSVGSGMHRGASLLGISPYIGTVIANPTSLVRMLVRGLNRNVDLNHVLLHWGGLLHWLLVRCAVGGVRISDYHHGWDLLVGSMPRRLHHVPLARGRM